MSHHDNTSPWPVSTERHNQNPSIEEGQTMQLRRELGSDENLEWIVRTVLLYNYL
jgi:hypothetical protein